MRATDKIPTLFVFNGTPIKVRWGFWPMVLGVWALLIWIGSWRWPGQPSANYVIVGGVGTLLAMIGDVGHACAHTVGARMPSAPMDMILLGADMPRTLYADNNVPPGTHILRSLGGPVYSAIYLLIGVGWLILTPPATALRYLGEVWTVTNGVMFLALFAPLPIVDGGVILKWALVMRGQTEEQADRLVKRICLGLGIVLLVVSVFFWVKVSWILGGVLLIVALVTVGAALHIIR